MTLRYVHTNLVALDWQRLAAFHEEVFEGNLVEVQTWT